MSVRIRAKAEALVTKSAVTTRVTTRVTKDDETALVTANANLQASILLGHRKDLSKGRNVVSGLFAELAAVSTDEIREALDVIRDEKTDAGSAQARAAIERAYDAAMALPGRATTAQRLAASLTSLIDAELCKEDGARPRQAALLRGVKAVPCRLYSLLRSGAAACANRGGPQSVGARASRDADA